MAHHSSTLAWKIPWMEEPGRLQSMGSLRIRHDWVSSLSFFTFMHWRRKWQPTAVFLPGESRDGGAWSAAIYGVSQSQTRLRWLSCSSRYCGFFFFPKLKVCGNPAGSKSISAIFFNSICSIHVSVAHCGNSHNTSNLFVISMFVMVICDQWSLMSLSQKDYDSLKIQLMVSIFSNGVF